MRKKAGCRQVKKQKRNTRNNYATGTDQKERIERENELEKLIEPLVDVPIDLSTTVEDKLLEALALYTQWKKEDKEGDILSLDEVVSRRRERCKDIGRIIFGHTLHDQQVDAIYTLFYEKRDLFLLAKTGFGKSLIFQLLPFMSYSTGVVIILMPLKLLQAEQNDMINCIPNGKAIALTGDNNSRALQADIATGDYTHVFTSPEIALTKKYKQNILDHSCFADRLCLLAIDEIHLVNQWSQSFRPLYAEIEKVRKRIPCDVPLLGVFATLTKKVRLGVLDKAGFHTNYKLMQTSLDRPEIMQIHRFMEHSKASCLDLQFVFLKKAKEARDIQKTIIFVNSVEEIRPMINILRAWMQKLGYPPETHNWIRPYYSTISEWDKKITATAFQTCAEDNVECTILIPTDAYGMGIDNPDIKLVIQWDIPISFDGMIQQMGRAGRKGGQAIFILLTPKWTKLKDQSELEERLAKRSASTNFTKAASTDQQTTRPINPSPLGQANAPDNFSDNESIASSANDSESETDFDQGHEDLMLAVSILNTETEDASKKKKIAKRISQSDAEKRARLPDEIFDYIHVAPCRRSFSLAWYDDSTYLVPQADGQTKSFPRFCCNGPVCQSEEPAILQGQEDFIDVTKKTFTEVDREWIAFRTAALKNWRKEASNRFWIAKGLAADAMPPSLILSDTCLSALAKSGGDLLADIFLLKEFLKPWHGADRHLDEIFECLQQSSPSKESSVSLPSRAERKMVLQAARLSKKLKYMDDPAVAEAAKLTALRDNWLIKIGKPSPATKLRIKQAADQAKKEKKQADNRHEKAREKAQANDIRRLAIENRQIEVGAFRAILSDPPTSTDNDLSDSLFQPPIIQTTATVLSKAKGLLLVGTKQVSKAKTADRLNKLRREPLAAKDANPQTTRILPSERSLAKRRYSAITPPPKPLQMELIRPGKRRVRVTANAVENTPPKRMRVAD